MGRNRPEGAPPSPPPVVLLTPRETNLRENRQRMNHHGDIRDLAAHYKAVAEAMGDARERVLIDAAHALGAVASDESELAFCADNLADACEENGLTAEWGAGRVTACIRVAMAEATFDEE